MHCAALPYVGQTHPHAQWIDTGSELPGFDNHVYLSSLAVEEAARLLGFVSAGEHRALRLECDELRSRVEQLEVELVEKNRHLDAIDLLESKGFTARKKPGRPKREAVEA